MASLAASGCTNASSEPARNTVAWITARRSGWTPRSGGMVGKTAAPSGTSAASSSAMSASRDRRDDRQLVAVLDRGGQVVQVTDVLVVEVQVHELLEPAALEQLLGHAG